MNKELFGITFASWEHIWYAPVIVFVAALLLWAYRKKMTIVDRLVKPVFRSNLLKGFSIIKQQTVIVLTMVAAFFLFLAFLQPQWDERERTVQQEGRDVFIALDVSRSMLAQDVQPNRLKFAKEKIKRLAKALGSDRVSLVLFSGSAFVYCPLTTDIAAFNLFLDQVDAETISSGTTAIDQAVERVLHTLTTTEGKKNKLLVIFTDGEDFSSNLSTIKQKAQQEGLTIFTVGVGTAEGAPVPVVDMHGKQTGHQKDERGSIVISRLNEGIINTLARDLGGAYIKATEDKKDITTLVRMVERFEKEKFDDKKVSSKEDRYPYFIVVALIALVLEWLL